MGGDCDMTMKESGRQKAFHSMCETYAVDVHHHLKTPPPSLTHLDKCHDNCYYTGIHASF